MARALINVPKTAKRGQIVEIKTLISHIMETGFRRTDEGKVIPRNIITELLCTYNGAEIFRATLSPAVHTPADSDAARVARCPRATARRVYAPLTE